MPESMNWCHVTLWVQMKIRIYILGRVACYTLVYNGNITTSNGFCSTWAGDGVGSMIQWMGIRQDGTEQSYWIVWKCRTEWEKELIYA